MSEQAYNKADMEVISMVNNRRSRSGQLPGKAVHYIPEERAKVVLDLDYRIERMRNALPGLALAVVVVFAALIGLAV